LCSAVDRLLKSGRSAPPSPPPAHKTAPSGIQLPQPRPSGAPSLALNPLIRAAPAPALVPLAIGPSAGGSQAEVVRKPRDVIFGVGLIVAILALLVTTVLLLPTGLTAIGDKLYYRECLGEPYAKGAFCCYYVASYMGNATAQFDLASMYDGDAFHGVEHDPAAATYWYSQAAAKKNPDALYSLAQVAKASKDSSVNAQTDDLMRRAFERFQELAGKGDVDAMTGLGTMYEAGDGTTLNYDKAHELYQRASDLGYPYADESLAMLYTNGHGVTVDKDKAQELYTKAYADGDFNAQNMKP
jgi:TPR repeat protein